MYAVVLPLLLLFALIPHPITSFPNKKNVPPEFSTTTPLMKIETEDDLLFVTIGIDGPPNALRHKETGAKTTIAHRGHPKEMYQNVINAVDMVNCKPLTGKKWKQIIENEIFLNFFIFLYVLPREKNSKTESINNILDWSMDSNIVSDSLKSDKAISKMMMPKKVGGYNLFANDDYENVGTAGEEENNFETSEEQFVHPKKSSRFDFSEDESNLRDSDDSEPSDSEKEDPEQDLNKSLDEEEIIGESQKSYDDEVRDTEVGDHISSNEESSDLYDENNLDDYSDRGIRNEEYDISQ